jgi:mono/diheme cytochrome c family protein
MKRHLVWLAIGAFIGAGGVAWAGQDAKAAEGEELFAAQRCVLCHAVAGKGNKAGALDGVAKKWSADDLRAWITTPAEMAKKHNATRKPPMKSFASLSKEDIDALVAYLQTLK